MKDGTYSSNFLPVEKLLDPSTRSLACARVEQPTPHVSPKAEMRVALVVMPFLLADRPSLAAGLLQAAVKARGIACDTKYFNLVLSNMVGHQDYFEFANLAPTCMAGEWIFSQLFYGTEISDWTSYERDVLRLPLWGLSFDDYERIPPVQRVAGEFLDTVFGSTNWGEYEIVGFTSTFEQTMPSLCLAKRIREQYPKVKLAMGGANCEGPMGLVYLRNFDFLDYVCIGEGENCFPELCQNLQSGSALVPPGILCRSVTELQAQLQRCTIEPVNVDLLPMPDFDDFYRDFRELFPSPDLLPNLTVETSRGCWWGEKCHCTFCGLNGSAMRYRQKSWERVAHEVDYLTDRYKSASIQFADNILSMDYFKNLLPYWSKRPSTISKFFEVKSNLNRHHLQVLKSAGVVHLQAGIENLADATLKVMKKGVRGSQNVAFLRWCAELGLQVHWNLIFGFPEEDLADYQLNLTLMRNIIHLAPPDGGGPIRLDRFSPNYMLWKESGFSQIRPMPAYRHVFALSGEEDFWDIAYYFDYDQPNLERVNDLTETLLAQVDTWREKKLNGEAGELAVQLAPGGRCCLVDTRFGFQPSRLDLERTTTALIAEFDKPSNPERAIDRTANRFSTSYESIRSTFEDLVERGVIAIIGNRAVTLTLLPDELRLRT